MLLDRFSVNKSKGMSEIKELLKPQRLKWNAKYNKIYKCNVDAFKKKDGVFTKMYDTAIRNGKLTMPFAYNAESNDRKPQ